MDHEPPEPLPIEPFGSRRRARRWPLFVAAALAAAALLSFALVKPLPGRTYSVAEEARVKYAGHAGIIRSGGAACSDCHRSGKARSWP